MALAPSLRSLLERPEAARRLGPFVLVHPLGSGGFAPVWLAREVYGGVEIRRVAVKLFAFDPDDPAASEEAQPRVMEEARLLCRVEHPNIPRFYSLLSDDASGVMGLVMEHVVGNSLDKRLKARRRMSVREALAIGIEVASALAAIHRAGLVHRDVKPANIIDAGGTHKLIDFGIASSRSAEPRSGRELVRRILAVDLPEDAVTAEMTTFSGLVRMSDGSMPLGADGLLPAGTPGYIDPYCVATSAQATPSSDLYALGVTLFESLTGVLPSVIGVGGGGGMKAQILDGREEAPPVAKHAQGVPPQLAALIDSLLSPKRERRPASAERVVLQLERIRAESLGRKLQLPPESVGPFRGLGRFEGADRDVYFGRSAEVAATLDLLRRRGLVTLAGASGAGKSSLARAGVAPHVAEEGLGGWVKKWDVVIAAPGPRPRDAIATALGQLVPDAGAMDPDQLAERMARGAESRGKGLLLVVDQLEEMVTVAAPDEALWLAGLLARIADPPHPFLRALTAARRDLLDPLLSIGPLGRALPRSLLVVVPMRGADWANAIDQALAAYDYSFEDAHLRDELLAEIEEHANAMPLVQFALTELWKHRDARRKIITRAALKAIGGLSGALERHAEATLSGALFATSLPLTAVREGLLAMTTPQGTRAVRTEKELEEIIGPGAHALVAQLEAARLLEREEGGVTLAHDALLTQWWRLRHWITTAREDRVLAEEIERDAARWQKEKEDPFLLWRKRRLAAAEDLLRVGLVTLSPLAQRFVRASRPMERRARAYLVVLAALALAAAIAGGVIYSRQVSSRPLHAGEQSELQSLRELTAKQEAQQCTEASGLRARANRALAEGRLLRALAILDRAEALQCPASKSEGLEARLLALSELHRTDDFEALAREVNEDAAAPEAARQAAARAAPAPDPDVSSLVRQGTLALEHGYVAESRRFFDRAVSFLERESTARLTLDLPHELQGEMATAAWSEEGDKPVTVIHGQVASVLDGKTLQEISRIPLDSTVLALSPDGKRVCLEAPEHGVKVLDTSTGRAVGALPVRREGILHLALSDGEPARVVVVLENHTKELWNLNDERPFATLPASGAVSAVAISKDGKLSSFGLADGTAALYAGTIRVPLFSPEGSSEVTSIAFSFDGRLMAWGTAGGAAWIAPTTGGVRPRALGGISGAVSGVVFSRDSRYVFASSAGSVYQWSTADFKPIAQTPASDRAIRVLASGPDGRVLAGAKIGGEAAARAALPAPGALVLFNASGRGELTDWRELGKDFSKSRALAFSPKGDALLSAMDDRTLRIFSITRAGSLRTVPDPAEPDPEPVPAAVAYSPDGRYFLAVTGRRAVRRWSSAGGDPREFAPADASGAILASFSASGERALTLSGEGRLRAFNMSTGGAVDMQQLPEQPLLAAAFEPDGRRILSIAADGARRYWDADTGSPGPSKPGEKAAFNHAVLSPGLKTFALWKQSSLRLRDVESGADYPALPSRGNILIRAVSISSDGKGVYAGDAEGLVRSWNLSPGTLNPTFSSTQQASRPGVRALAVSPAAPVVVAAALDSGAILFYRMDSTQQAAAIWTVASDGKAEAASDEKKEAAIVAAADGHFDFIGSNRCAAVAKVICRVGSVELPFEACEDRFYSPGLLARLLTGDSSYAEPEAGGDSLGCSP